MTHWLVLIPTEGELEHFPEDVRSSIEARGCRFEICGFGPIISAVRAANLINEHRPSRVILCGVAGTLKQRLTVGAAYLFDEVACYGIGAGCGANFQTASEMGWQQWGANENRDSSSAISDTIQLAGPSFAQGLMAQGPIAQEPRMLLSVCAASSGATDVELKLKKFPAAVAEEMEGFSVAAACKLAGLPLHIVRGISNQAGDRDHRNWKIDKAMQSAALILEDIIRS